MAEGGNYWDFDCPQFYDFCDGVEDKTVNIESLGGDSPALENKFNFKSKHLMKNKFGTLSKKNSNYLTISTPINKSSFVNIDRQTNTTDSEKLNKRKKRLSRSEGCVNAIGACGNIFKAEEPYCPGFTHKRSVSDSDIRPKKKYPITPKKIPATPMCLKRTQRRDRTKKIKTTEELELEKIAQLQSLTLKHLRLNEMNMRKLKLNPKSSTVPKPIPLKYEKERSAPVKQFQKDLDDVTKRLNSNKNARITVLNRAKRSERLGPVSNVFDVELPSSSCTVQPPASNQLDEVQDTADENSVLDELSFKNPGHSGVFFHMNKSKNAALKPFNFHDRVKVSGPSLLSKSSMKVNKENTQVPKVQFSHSFHASNLGNRNNNKENVCMNMAPKSAGVIKKSFKL